jgi:hypothetical protein
VGLNGWVVVWRSKLLFSSRITQAGLLAITVASIVSTGYWMINNHPMQNIYFNFLAGKNRHERFDLDYWGLGNRILLEKILAGDSSPVIYLQPISSTPIDNSFRIIEPKLRARLKMVGDFHSENNEVLSPVYRINNFMRNGASTALQKMENCEITYAIKDGDELILTACKVLEN